MELTNEISNIQKSDLTKNDFLKISKQISISNTLLPLKDAYSNKNQNKQGNLLKLLK